MMTTFKIEEEERQLLVLGLALMAIQRPGFVHACRNAAITLSGEQMFVDFMRYNETPRDETQKI